LSRTSHIFRENGLDYKILCSPTLYLSLLLCTISGPGSSVGIATDYRLDGPGSNSSGTRFSARPDWPCGPTSLLQNGYRVFPGGKVRPGRAADHSPLSSAEVMEE